jgi:glycosyltransferase involved in cell wall biosynthesis
MENATAVVTHSHFAAEQFRDRYIGDISVLPLPVLHAPHVSERAVRLPIDLERPIILQAGTLNENKCIDLVIEAFSRSRSSSTAQLVICGHGPDETVDRLKRLANRVTGHGDVIVLGAVTDDVLHALRTHASVSTVLRYPSSEASSAVLIDSMAYGNAVLVTDASHYGEMPHGTVHIVPAPPSVDDVATALDTLLADPSSAATMGSRAASYVHREHTANNYARKLVPVLRSAGAALPRQQLARGLAEVLNQLGFTPDSTLISRLASTTVELFGATPRKPELLDMPRARSRASSCLAAKRSLTPTDTV